MRRSPPKKETPAAAPNAGARERMVSSAARLLGRDGLQATSFSEVLADSKAPRGSVYHHFPGGKNQLVVAAVDFAGEQLLRIIDRKEGAAAVEITELFLSIWRSILTTSKLRAGCAVVAVTVAADSPELLEHTAATFRSWRTRLAALLTKGGIPRRDATAFAALLVASSEGAVVIARGEQDIEVFEVVAAQLLAQARQLQTA